MTPESNPSRPSQPVEFSRRVTGRRNGQVPVRLKARHLSEPLRREIVELFDLHESHDDVADVMQKRENLKGITAKTVAEVMDLWHMRKTVQSERVAVRLRTAGGMA